MYTLYHATGACSLATLVILNELNIPASVVNIETISNFDEITPVTAVPTLIDDGDVLTEGAAIIIHLLNKHDNLMLPVNGKNRQKAIQQIMFANATMHPAYSKLFFIAQNISDPIAKEQAFSAALQQINKLWNVVENQLKTSAFLGGESLSAADIMLAVYASWGEFFPVDIQFGEATSAMLLAVRSRQSFRDALVSELTG